MKLIYNLKNKHFDVLAGIFILTLFTTVAKAQNTQSGYFVDGYLYRHELNPAIGNEQNYIAMPALGNLNVAMRGNIAFDNVFRSINGKTTTFLNPQVDVADFMGKLKDDNHTGADIRVNILSAGFKAFGGYNTVSVNARTNIYTSIPKSLFSLAKEGPYNQTYDIHDFTAVADAYAEVALGHSHQINEQWRVGGTVKVLIGGGNVEAKFDKAQLVLDKDAFHAVTNATINSSVKGLTYNTETTERGAEGEKTLHTYVNGADVDGAGVNGFGLAVDLGAQFKLNQDWEFSASLLDLGFIRWSNNMVASTNGDREFNTDIYLFSPDDDAPNSFEREMDRLSEGLSALYELQDNGDAGGRTTGLSATMNIGAKYTLPKYRQLAFGLTNTTRMGKYAWTDFRLSANWSPVKIVSASVNLGVGTYGASFGWMANFHPNGFNLYFAMDHTVGKIAKQGLPLSGNAQFNMGINFPF
ncbi:MAG: DUF5723 family protein [Bacteroidaceae bacterium]|nr:DUF5723 family protein [Bacteroidaceae bacterium]